MSTNMCDVLSWIMLATLRRIFEGIAKNTMYKEDAFIVLIKLSSELSLKRQTKLLNILFKFNVSHYDYILLYIIYYL